MSAVDDYLEGLPAPERAALERIRKIVRKAVPGVEETSGYGMPAFKSGGTPILYFAAFKDHLSLFPTSGPIAGLGKKLAGFKTSKGTIQFTVGRPLPESLIREIIAARLREIGKEGTGEAGKKRRT